MESIDWNKAPEGAMYWMGESAAWSGWGCQYPGKMPRMYGDRRIAELNCDRENGDQVLHFTATQRPVVQPSLQLPEFATDPDDSDEGASLLDHGFKWGWNACLEAVAKTMQSAEQQPARVDHGVSRNSRNLRGVHAMILNALDRDAADGKAARGEMAAELRSVLSEQQSAPNVSALVEALKEIVDPVRFMQERLEEGERLNGLVAVQLAEDASYLKDIAKAALAAYHKQGGDV